MIAGLQMFAFGIATAASINAIVSWSAQMPADCRFWSVLVVASLAVFFALKHVEATRKRREKAEREALREYREQWFASFERRHRMIASRGPGREALR